MPKPQEFTIRIEPDGHIVLEMDGLQETSYRRILQLLEEQVGPVQEIQLVPEDPPVRKIAPTKSDQIEIGRQKSG